MGGHQRLVRALALAAALAAALHVAVANECANEPPLLGAHYMTNWHTGRWSQWRRCHDAEEMNKVYPERVPLTGAYHDEKGWYRLESTAGPKYPDCSAVRGIPNCNTGRTNRPCCDQHNCLLEANGHMSCFGGSDAYSNSDFSGRGFGPQSDGVIPPQSGLQTMRNEIAAAGAYGLGFFAVETFGGVRGASGVTDRLASPNSDPFDTEMYLILQSETEVSCRMRPLSNPT